MTFAIEGYADELAAAAGKDPHAYQLQLRTKDTDIKHFDATWHTSRLRSVLQLAAEKAEWQKPLPPGRHRGVACFGCFSSYAAAVIEISMEGGKPRVHRVVDAID